jgi:hypothetical protein
MAAKLCYKTGSADDLGEMLRYTSYQAKTNALPHCIGLFASGCNKGSLRVCKVSLGEQIKQKVNDWKNYKRHCNDTTQIFYHYSNPPKVAQAHMAEE